MSVPTRSVDNAESVLRIVAEATAASTGRDFFRALVKHLAAAIDVRFAFVAERIEPFAGRMRIVAMWDGRGFVEDMEYDVAGTPCETLVGREPAYFPSGVQERFPDDQWLRHAGIESYLAIPLFDTAERPLGHLGIMHVEPIDKDWLATPALMIFAARNTVELERWHTEERLRAGQAELKKRVRDRTRSLAELKEMLRRTIADRMKADDALVRSNRTLQSILDSIGDGVVVADENGRFIQFNPAAERILRDHIRNIPPDEWTEHYGVFLPDKVTPYPPDQLPLARAMRGEVVSETEVFMRHKGVPDGIWVSGNACPLNDATGALRGGVAVFRDVTANRRAEDELKAQQRLLLQMLSAHERDRQLTAYEIHDGLVQYATGAVMRLEVLRRDRATMTDDQREHLDVALQLVRQTIDEGRRLITGLRPPIIDEKGVIAAIHYLINAGPPDEKIRIDFLHDVRFHRLPLLLEGTIYRIVQEALANIRQHSGAARAAVRLEERGNRIYLEVRDWGHGFDAAQVAEQRYGLQGIRERARLLGGRAQVESTPGEGTRVVVELPLLAAVPPSENSAS